MSSIKRTNETESYKVTVGWLDSALKKIVANLPPSPVNLPKVSTEKFATIEDKMMDIKARVGFDSIKKVTSDSSDVIISEASKKKKKKKKCNCDGECSCYSDELSVRKSNMQNLLKYIQDMISSEPHLLEPEIMARCLDNKDLGVESIKINNKKLKQYIRKLKKNHPSAQVQMVAYVSPDIHNQLSQADDIADYFQHGTPNKR
jgi:hypothetical protein